MCFAAKGISHADVSKTCIYSQGRISSLGVVSMYMEDTFKRRKRNEQSRRRLCSIVVVVSFLPPRYYFSPPPRCRFPPPLLVIPSLLAVIFPLLLAVVFPFLPSSFPLSSLSYRPLRWGIPSPPRHFCPPHHHFRPPPSFPPFLALCHSPDSPASGSPRRRRIASSSSDSPRRRCIRLAVVGFIWLAPVVTDFLWGLTSLVWVEEGETGYDVRRSFPSPRFLLPLLLLLVVGSSLLVDLPSSIPPSSFPTLSSSIFPSSSASSIHLICLLLPGSHLAYIPPWQLRRASMSLPTSLWKGEGRLGQQPRF